MEVGIKVLEVADPTLQVRACMNFTSCVHVCARMCVLVCLCTYVYVCIHMCVHVCAHVCTGVSGVRSCAGCDGRRADMANRGGAV